MQSYIMHACVDCGKVRHVQLYKGGPRYKRCLQCSRTTPESRHAVSLRKTGERHHNWTGGISKCAGGYIGRKVFLGDFFFSMANSKHYILEHRLIMAQYLKRCLLPWEIVHHKNGIKTDNRLENLALLSNRGNHNSILNRTIKQQQKRIKFLEARVTQLEAEMALRNETLSRHLAGERIQPAEGEKPLHISFV